MLRVPVFSPSWRRSSGQLVASLACTNFTDTGNTSAGSVKCVINEISFRKEKDNIGICMILFLIIFDKFLGNRRIIDFICMSDWPLPSARSLQNINASVGDKKHTETVLDMIRSLAHADRNLE